MYVNTSARAILHVYGAVESGEYESGMCCLSQKIIRGKGNIKEIDRNSQMPNVKIFLMRF